MRSTPVADPYPVAQGIEGSQEYKGVEVEGLYERFLPSAPADPAGFGRRRQFLLNGGSIEQLEAILIGSTEYFQNRAAARTTAS